MPDPTEFIKQYFGFLVAQYGFVLARSSYSHQFTGNAEVLFISECTGVKIVVDRSQVLIDIGRITLPEEEWFDLSDIITFYDVGMETYKFEKTDTAVISRIEQQIIHLATLVRTYCHKILSGDFSDENAVKTIETKRVKEMSNQFQRLSRKQSR